ncbi:dr1-associated corepressor isoform X1 [Dendrobium catenatum]|uniref:Nuclear transcription factor Y subunit C-3 n=2 Tax=Dendrobium catenatum TaxID=906689 RepID=A0A2I0W1E1_9ASPA|nr:dr1-associated corepressor isoform X1 [Dendrobium catenatum]PKU69472.1 Nuclear transcription factor Y subunit C-3 [Dendrobium catenatum]
MRKKLGTRFPAPRIKKIMQADEDIGKIALAVPLLVSKALELFLQDLCDRTYEVTLQRGAKTLNSLHLKQCVKMYGAFDFLTDVVNKVPNLGGTESFGDEKGICRRRKTIEHDGDTTTDESRFAKVAMTSTNISPRGRGRGRGRSRGRPPLNRNLERESSLMKYEDEIDLSPEHEDPITDSDATEKAKDNITDFTNPASILSTEANPGEYSAWPLPDEVVKLGIEPSNLANINLHLDEDEDYDNED